MNNLIQALTAYTGTLEQQLAALEARVAQLEAQLEKVNETVKVLGERLEANEAKGEKLSVEEANEEPEIEVELIMEEEEIEEEPIETLDIVEETPAVEEPAVEEPAVEEPAVEEPIVEEPIVVEPIAEPVMEPVVEKPAPRPMPQQTSLFGTAVEDIRQAISLGDRFLFQRELFAGNGELMQKTLDEINGLDSFNEAMEYVMSNFEWDKESTAVQLFENVLKRRFA